MKTLRVFGCLGTLGLLGLAQPTHAQNPDSVTAWDAAHASATVTICLRSLTTPTTITQEALHRIEAELSASGFLVDQAGADQPCSPQDPSVKLRSSQTVIDISASAGPGDDPVLQSVNVRDSHTTAELIAIRAVEGLRAAMMQALRRSPDGMETAPETVRRFTRQDEAPEPKAPEPADPEKAVQAPPTVPPDEQTEGGGQRKAPPTLDLLLTVGGALAWDGATPGMNATLGVAWLLSPIALGIGIDAGVVPGSWNATAGSIELRPFGLTGNVAVRLPCSRKWECHLGLAAGLRQFSMGAVSTPGGGPGTSEQENHASAVLMLDGLLGYFLVPQFGLFTRAQGGLLLDAPSVQIGDESLVWGRPSLALTFGVAARF